jgi:S1-C subfamily serine protease
VNIVDWILLAALIIFAAIGWQRGFISGLLSFGGFLAGGLVALAVLPRLLETTNLPTFARGLIVAGGILVFALSGQFIAGLLGDRLSRSLIWRPVRVLDHAAGAMLNVLVLAVLTWIVVSIVAYLPSSSLTSQMTDSKVASALDALVPPQAGRVFDGLQSALSTTAVPALLEGFTGLSGPDVPPPSGTAVTPAVRVSAASVVRVFGDASDCDSQVSGSGFVVGPGVVITNAHVVAGVVRPMVRAEGGSTRQSATLVYFDPVTDIAILHVPGLNQQPLELAAIRASSGDPAVVAGYPLSGPFAMTPVRVRTVVEARRDDIYGNSGSTREVYIVRGTVRRGDSGGPLIATDGTVLGMIFGADENQSSNGYALTAEDLAAAISAAEGLTDPIAAGDCHIRD